MKLVLLGFGKVNRLIDELAQRELPKTEVLGVFNRTNPLNANSQSILKRADVCIDFSHPSVVLSHAQYALKANCPLVIGTTGWTEHLPKLEQWVKESDTACLFSPNFSLGMYFFTKIVQNAHEQLSPWGYQLHIEETHHEEKVDSPSGTALALSHLLQRYSQSIDIVSKRVKQVVGIHECRFTSELETISLTHKACERKVFAEGALKAAHWIKGKKGFFTMDDFISAKLESAQCI